MEQGLEDGILAQKGTMSRLFELIPWHPPQAILLGEKAWSIQMMGVNPIIFYLLFFYNIFFTITRRFILEKSMPKSNNIVIYFFQGMALVEYPS